MTLLAVRLQDSSSGVGSKMSGEFVALCPGCKAMQTLWFDNDRMTPTRKFSQRSSHIYHDCGTGDPCRLYRSY